MIRRFLKLRNASSILVGYYKVAKDLIDEGQFGSTLIFSPFNHC